MLLFRTTQRLNLNESSLLFRYTGIDSDSTGSMQGSNSNVIHNLTHTLCFLLSSNPLLHLKLHQRPEQDTKIDLDRHNNNDILEGFDVGEIHIRENLESAVSTGGGNQYSHEQQQTNKPVLAGVLGEFFGADGAVVNIDQSLESVVDVGDEVDDNACWE